MLQLPNITLVALTSVRIEEHRKAIEYSQGGIKFGDVKLILDVPCKNIDEWNKAIIYDLPKYITTEFCLLIHDNGFVVNPDKWNPDWLNYDYIGAPWPIPQPNDIISYRDNKGNLIRQGNSVSLRSKKLLDIAPNTPLEWKSFHGWSNEDGFICVNNRHIYEEQGCNFASLDVAKYFSHETQIPEIQGIVPFAFHNYIGDNTQYPRF